MIKLVEVEPGRWRVDRPAHKPARSDLPVPYVISDTMDPTEQVDGKFYTSKRQYRAVGKSLGLVEVGTEKQKPRKRFSDPAGRRAAIKQGIEKFKAGHRAT